MENIKKNAVMEQTKGQDTTPKMGNKHVLEGLKARTIAAKLRDAVIISINDETGELGRYKNIELPDVLRDLSVQDFQFTKSIDGKLEFELHFKTGTLPNPMPEPRAKVTRAEKAAAVKVAPEKKPDDMPKTAPAPVIAPKPPVAATIVPIAPQPKEAPKAPALPPVAAKTAALAPKDDKPKETAKGPEKVKSK